MAAMIRTTVQRSGILKPALLFIGCLLFAVSGRMKDVSFEQHIVSAASDHYYILYFLLPVILWILSSYMEDDPMTVIVRHCRFSDFFSRKWVSVSAVGLVLIAVQTVAILLSGAGLHLNGNIWEAERAVTNDEQQLISLLTSCFRSPILCFAVLMIWQCIGICVISGIFIWLGHFAGKKTGIILILLIYLYSVLWTKLGLFRKIPLTGFNHLLILHHNLILPHRILITICEVTAALILIMITVRFCWNRAGAAGVKRKGLLGYYLRNLMSRHNLLILTGVVLMMTVYKIMQTGTPETWEHWAEEYFAGHGIGTFRPIAFLEMLLVNLTPVYLLAAFTQRMIDGQSLSTVIRAGTKKKLMVAHLGAGMLFIILYLGMLLGGVLAGGIATGLGHPDVLITKLLAGELILKLIDIWLQFLIFLIIYYMSGKSTAGFAVLIVGNMLCILPEKVSGWILFGISSVSRFYDAADISTYIGRYIVVLLIACVAITAWLMTAGKEKMTEINAI